MVANDEGLGDLHVHVLVREFKSQDFLRDLELDWISLSLDKEIEGPVVDVVGDWSAESLGGLAAEYDVETSLLAWWYHL